MIVVDASLGAKWMVVERDSPEALRFLLDPEHELCSPDLFFTEVAAVIVRKGNENKDWIDDAREALDKWTIAWSDHLVATFRVTQRRLHRAGQLALQLGHPLADCIYLALAIELDCDLATCDAKFAKKAMRLWPRVRLLESYST